MSTEIFINERIPASYIRLIDDEKMIGVLSLPEGIRMARDRGLDLVMIAAGEQPVCRILDADRYRFEKSKQDREQSRKQRELAVETKEIQLRPVTGEADLSIKARRAREFLEDGDKVKVVVRFRGREKSHKEEGRRILLQFVSEVGEHRVEKHLSVSESDMMMILGSTVAKADRIKEKRERAA